MNNAGMRISGLASPPFLWASYKVKGRGKKNLFLENPGDGLIRDRYIHIYISGQQTWLQI